MLLSDGCVQVADYLGVIPVVLQQREGFTLCIGADVAGL